jgi:hypothetical protein
MRVPMARGWESKAVDELRDEPVVNAPKKRTTRTPEEQERTRKRGELELARKRVLGDLDTARHARHRELLERTLADLDKRIRALDAEAS